MDRGGNRNGRGEAFLAVLLTRDSRLSWLSWLGVLVETQQGGFMMNEHDGWMGGWTGGGMWLWVVVAVVVVGLLLVVVNKRSKK